MRVKKKKSGKKVTPLAEESIVQISGVKRSNVISDGGEFLLAMQGSPVCKARICPSKEGCGSLEH